MASIVAWLVGLLFFGLGLWILLLRFEGLIDRFQPHSMCIGSMTVDSQESKSHAELLRARFDHHFRRPVAIPKETGFLEVVALDAPQLFQPQAPAGRLETMTLEVSGVDVSRLVRLVNQLFKPDQWVLEGDFQFHADRALLALRLVRGQRLIRTWYLERPGATLDARSTVVEQLLDDAVFQIVYDFGNPAEQDDDVRKLSRLVPPPAAFPSRAAVAAYYGAQGALGRYYAHGDWKELDQALERLRELRAQMPDDVDGLQLLGMALAEKRQEAEAIHVYEHLRLVLSSDASEPCQTDPEKHRRLAYVDLLEATAKTKLFTWQSTHEAVAALERLAQALTDCVGQTSGQPAVLFRELLAQAAVQLAYAYALYLDYLRHFTVAEVLGSPAAPEELRIEDAGVLAILKKPSAELASVDQALADQAKQIVLRAVAGVARQHEKWLARARAEHARLESEWGQLDNPARRRAELTSRIHFAAGYAHYHMAQWEPKNGSPGALVFAKPYEARLNEADKELRRADAAHPNHYLVLQLLGLVHSERRYEGASLDIAEQYFERAIAANPSDDKGYELLAGVLLRRVANRGIDIANRPLMEKGRAIAESAIARRDTSGQGHLLRAYFQTLLLEVERDEGKRRELRAGLEQQLDQAHRFLPRAFGRADPDLSWLRIIARIRRLADAPDTADAWQAPAALRAARGEVAKMLDDLIAHCQLLEKRWVAHQRRFHVELLRSRAQRLAQDLANSPSSWREIAIPFD